MSVRKSTMHIRKLGNGWLLFATLILGTACGSGVGGSDEGASLDFVKPYATTCTQTVCEKQATACRTRERQLCDDCYDSCSSPYQSDQVLCASICHDICSTSDCNSCSAPKDECAAQGVRFDPPPLNTELRSLSVSKLNQCQSLLSADNIAKLADFHARSFRHEYASVLECILAKGCGAYKECGAVAANGSVGTALCARQQACGTPCAAVGSDHTATYIDGLEPFLRPALVVELTRCSRETDCATATACWNALRPALGLAEYPTRP